MTFVGKFLTCAAALTMAVGCGVLFNTSEKVSGISASAEFVQNGTSLQGGDPAAVSKSKSPKAVKARLTKNGSKVKLSWSKTKCTAYRIYVCKNGKWKVSRTISNKKTSYTYTKLPNGTYYFKVVPVNKISGKIYKSSPNKALKAVIKTAAKTPVAAHGRLSVKGNKIVDKYGKVFKIKGMSTHGIMWENFGDVLSYNSLKTLRDDWKINTIRIAMYTEEYGGYTTGGNFAAQATAKVTAAVENARKLGLYVIIDWHILKDGDPNKHINQSKAFFSKMAKKYKNYNNVLFEICNEPNGGVTWTGGIKKYCQTIVRTIRAQGNKSIIICGTGTWSQDIDQVLGNRIKDKNCVYSLHFYANTHTDWLRDRLRKCYNKGLPVLVTEFGTCDASGNGGYNPYQTKLWLKLLNKLKVGYINWSLAGKAETASAFKPGTDLKNIKKGTSQLTESGKLIRTLFS